LVESGSSLVFILNSRFIIFPVFSSQPIFQSYFFLSGQRSTSSHDLAHSRRCLSVWYWCSRITFQWQVRLIFIFGWYNKEILHFGGFHWIWAYVFAF